MSKVAIFLADGFEEVEGLTVVDLLRRVGIEINMISIMNQRNVTSSHNVEIMADYLFDEVDYSRYDMLIFPGGMPGTKNLGMKEEIIKLIHEFYNEEKWLAAICAAPRLFGMEHLLEGKRATCFPEFRNDLYGAILSDEKVVVDGKIITSRGLGTAIEFAGAIIQELLNKEKSLEVLRTIQYL